MASSKFLDKSCSECGRYIELLNGNIPFSMNLHKQSHKSLEIVNKDLNYTQKEIENTSKFNKKYCDECEEDIEIFNHDVSFSIQLHTQKHKHDKADALSDHSSTAGRKIRCENKYETIGKARSKPVLTSIVEATFHTMPFGLKAHSGFISEKDCNKANCNLCGITIEPILTIADHLKSKLHEDNTIHIIKTLLPSELQDQMEFVIFCDYHLYCNLCGYKIDLCSNNVYKTVINIFAHNVSNRHLSEKSNTSENSQLDKPLAVLKNLACLDPLVNENQDLIKYEINPYYRCKVCDIAILYSENEKELINNFKFHLIFPGHKKTLDAVSILNKWNDLNITGKQNHSFVVAKQHIYCSICSCSIETNLEQLVAHVERCVMFKSAPLVQPTNPQNAQIYHLSSSRDKNVQRTAEPTENVTLSEGNIMSGIPVKKTKIKKNTKLANEFDDGKPLSSTNRPLSNKTKVSVNATYKKLLNTNQTIKFNDKYLEKEDNLYRCMLCNRTKICANNKKLLEKNVMSHISGKKHSKNAEKEFDDMLNKAQLSNKVIKTNRKFLVREGGGVFCTLCNKPLGDDDLIKNVMIHLEGYDHVRKKMALETNNTSASPPEIVKPDHPNLTNDSIETNLEPPFANVKRNSAMFVKTQFGSVPGMQQFTNPPTAQMSHSSSFTKENLPGFAETINQKCKPETGEQLPSTNSKWPRTAKVDDVDAEY